MLDTGLNCVPNDIRSTNFGISTGIDIGSSAVCRFCKDRQFSPFKQGLAICSDQEAAGQPQ